MDYWPSTRPISIQANHKPTIALEGVDGMDRNLKTAASGHRR